MSIQRDTLELQSLNTELTRLRREITQLKKQKNDCERRILNYLDNSKQPGIKFNGQVIIAVEKSKRRYKNKTDKILCGEDVLRKYGIENTKDTLNELLETMKGTPETIRMLKLQTKI